MRRCGVTTPADVGEMHSQSAAALARDPFAGVVVRARARLPVRQRGFANLADASAAAPVLLGTLGVAVPRLEARRALPGGVGGAAVHAAAKLLHARDGFGVALPGGLLDVLAGEEHVHVAEHTLAKHLAELPLRLLESLMRRRAEPPRRLEDVILVSRGFLAYAFDEAHGVLSVGRARECDCVAQRRDLCLVESICSCTSTKAHHGPYGTASPYPRSADLCTNANVSSCISASDAPTSFVKTKASWTFASPLSA
jgi:hypothetical protein